MDWKDINIKTFDKMRNIPESLSDIERTKRIIEILFDIPAAYAIPTMEFGKYIDELAGLNKEMKEYKPRHKYELNGRKYELAWAIENWTVAQYIDFITMIRNNDSYSRILECVLIPKGKKYNTDYDIEKAYEDISELNIEEAKSIYRYYFRLLPSFIDNFRHYLTKLNMEAATKEKIIETLEILSQRTRTE